MCVCAPHARMCVLVHMCVHTDVWAYICVGVYMCACVGILHVCVCECMCMHVYVCAVCTCLCICICACVCYWDLNSGPFTCLAGILTL